MDPCCGPGTWLLPFAAQGLHVAGNDLMPGMVEEARRQIPEGDSEWTVGDMRDLRFQTGPFDAALNMHASIGHLPDLEAATQHLRSVHGSLRKGGVYVLGLVVNDQDRVDRNPMALFESEPIHLEDGGVASVCYESVLRDGIQGMERIRVLLLTAGVEGCPQVLQEEYELRSFRAEELSKIIDEAHFELLATYAMEEDEHPEVEFGSNCGDVTVILRAR